MYKDLTEEIVAYKLSRIDKVDDAQYILTQYLKDNDLWNHAPWEDDRDMRTECQSFCKGSAFHNVMLNKKVLDEWYEPVYKPISFSKSFMKDLGFKTTKDDGTYGVAKDIRTNGMTVIYWNRGGHSCTYFGDKLEKNISVTIRKDGDSRTAFNGYIFHENQLKDLLEMTW